VVSDAVAVADDRIADDAGWVDFDVRTITCPVVVLHGTEDRMCRPVQAEHTAREVPGAELRLVEGAGHFSVVEHVVPVLLDLV
jgi:pimeloyl-ACP methyl ester carboxylesterase